MHGCKVWCEVGVESFELLSRRCLGCWYAEQSMKRPNETVYLAFICISVYRNAALNAKQVRSRLYQTCRRGCRVHLCYSGTTCPTTLEDGRSEWKTSLEFKRKCLSTRSCACPLLISRRRNDNSRSHGMQVSYRQLLHERAHSVLCVRRSGTVSRCL